MKLPLRYDPQEGLVDADGKVVASFDVTDFDYSVDNEHGTQLATAMNCHADLLAACEEAIPWIEEAMPLPTHAGSCGPESGCDGGCMAMAAWAEAIGRIKKAIEKTKSA